MAYEAIRERQTGPEAFTRRAVTRITRHESIERPRPLNDWDHAQRKSERQSVVF